MPSLQEREPQLAPWPGRRSIRQRDIYRSFLPVSHQPAENRVAIAPVQSVRMGFQGSEPTEPGSTYVRSLISFAISAIGGELQSASSGKKREREKNLVKARSAALFSAGSVGELEG